MIRRSPVDLSVSAGGCIAAALIVLILPLPWLTALFLAAAIHEVCHLLCLRLFMIRVFRIRIGMQGTSIETAALSPIQELLCAAAGPAGSFLCLLFLRHFPILALCGLLQGSYNLLPIYPLDGGRILHAIVCLLFPHRGETICKYTSLCVSAGIFTICLILYIRTSISIFLLCAGYFVLLCVLQRKTPCKGGQN